MSPAWRVPAVRVVGAGLCGLAATALWAMTATTGWNLSFTYGRRSSILAALFVGALVVTVVATALVLLALWCLGVAVRRRGLVLAVSALVTVGSIVPPAAYGVAAHDRDLRAAALACRPDVLRDVLVLAEAAGRVIPLNDSDAVGRTDGRCVVVVAVRGDTAATMRALDSSARGLGWVAQADRTWRSPAGVIVTAEPTPHAESSAETVVELGARGR